MDEGLLNDLLECSVCLERLDTSSRVLPCQHTFCLKCLKEIVQSHKELRCPECRVPVEAKLEELPPNVLLMRILEGMKSSAPRRQPPARDPRSAVQATPQHGGGAAAARHAGDSKPAPRAHALYDYVSKEPGDLTFQRGDVIMLHKRVDASWYRGECGGRVGIFPAAYAHVAVPLPAAAALCKALYDFRMSAPDEEGCLAFDKGAIISVLRRVDDNWAEGRLGERVGIFPLAFVELNHAARDVIHAHSSLVAGRAVPPVPEQQRPHDHRHFAQFRYQQMALSTPVSASQNYQHMANMSQSHPVYLQPPPGQGGFVPASQTLVPQPVSHAVPAITHGGALVSTAVHRSTEQAHPPTIDLIQFTNIHNKTSPQTMSVQSTRIADGYDNRLRAVNYDSYNSTPVHQTNDKTYQSAKRTDNYLISAAFNATNSSDSSSSVTTPSISTSAPNTTSNSSSDSTEPSSPCSPDNNETTTAAPSTHPAVSSPPARETADTSADLETSANTSGTSRPNESSCSTNTSLNVSLPPLADSPKNASPQPSASKPDADTPKDRGRHETASSSKSSASFGPAAQASPAREPSAGGYLVATRHRDHRHRDRDKRNSLTPLTHLAAAQHASHNRHSAEILSAPRAAEAAHTAHAAHERDRRRRRSRSDDRVLPAPYVALYPYRPHKSDELELCKGVIYTVTERCQDGWYKGCSTRTQRCGVFPGNYVAPATRKHNDKSSAAAAAPQKSAPAPTSVRAEPAPSPAAANTVGAPAPDAPPRAGSPAAANGTAHSFPWPSGAPSLSKSTEKSKEKPSKQEKSGVSLMKRLAAMKKCRSPPPPAGYSLDNPVFEDCMPPTATPPRPAHVRSGSCPSQLLQPAAGAAAAAGEAAPAGGSVSAAAGRRLLAAHRPGSTAGAASSGGKHRERPSALAALGGAATLAHGKHHAPLRASAEGAWGAAAAAAGGHRKSQSLDAGAAARDLRKERHHDPPLNERFRCVVPYPPNSSYELELRLHDVVLVHRKRGDGWYKGTLERTGRTGLFPASFVQSCGGSD